MPKNEYEEQAERFLKITDSTLEVKFLRSGKHFPDDKEDRDIYEVSLKSRGREYKFNFGQSIINSGYKLLFRNGGQILYMPKDYSKRTTQHAKRYFIDKIHSLNQTEIKEPKAPRAYDILAAVTKHFPGDFEYFCSEYGYNNDSIQTKEIYTAVMNEYMNIAALYSESELELMREIA